MIMIDIAIWRLLTSWKIRKKARVKWSSTGFSQAEAQASRAAGYHPSVHPWEPLGRDSLMVLHR